MNKQINKLQNFMTMSQLFRTTITANITLLQRSVQLFRKGRNLILSSV